MNNSLPNPEHKASPVNDRNFAREVLQAAQPVLVDFWAPWCGPCRMIAPVVEELAGEFAGKAKVVKVDVDESGQTAAHYGIRGIPTLMIFKNGQVVETVVGAVSKKALTEKLNAHLS